MSKNANVNATQQALNALLPANIRNNAVIIPPPQPAKSLQEALDRGLSTFQRMTPTGYTYTIDVERALRCRHRNKIQRSNHRPRALEEPDQRDREILARGRLPPPPPKFRHLHLLCQRRINWFLKWARLLLSIDKWLWYKFKCEIKMCWRQRLLHW